MKRQNHAISIVLGLFTALLILANQLGWQLPLLTNDHATLIVVGVLGMALCSQGIGRIAEDKKWLHPISLMGMVVGAAILAVWVGRLFGASLPFAATDSQAILTMGILMGVKWTLSRLYGLLRNVKRSRQLAV